MSEGPQKGTEHGEDTGESSRTDHADGGYAEVILRSIKRVEYRSRPAKIIGERFYIYAAKKWAGVDGQYPTGVIVGTAVISHVT